MEHRTVSWPGRRRNQGVLHGIGEGLLILDASQILLGEGVALAHELERCRAAHMLHAWFDVNGTVIESDETRIRWVVQFLRDVDIDASHGVDQIHESMKGHCYGVIHRNAEIALQRICR